MHEPNEDKSTSKYGEEESTRNLKQHINSNEVSAMSLNLVLHLSISFGSFIVPFKFTLCLALQKSTLSTK